MLQEFLCLISRTAVHSNAPGSSLRWMSPLDLKLIWTAVAHHKLFPSCEIAFLFFFSAKQEKINRLSNAIPYYIDQNFGIKNVCPLTFSLSEIFQWLQCAWHQYVPQETLQAIHFFSITDSLKNVCYQPLFKNTRHDWSPDGAVKMKTGR